MMMQNFLIDNFFETKIFAHAKIFEKYTYVWEALKGLEEFFRQTSKGKIACEIPKGVTLVHPEKISIGKGTIIEPGAYIKGPCILGENCEVRHGAYIRGFVLTGDNCLIGHGTEVKSSIFFNNVSSSHFNYVGDSILGNQVNLGAGVKLANFRLDHQPIYIFDEGEKIPTQLKKLGALIGDGTQIGCNTVTNPGTILGKEVFCPPCITIGGYIPSYIKIKSKNENIKICQQK